MTVFNIEKGIDGLFSALFISFTEKRLPVKVVCENPVQERIGFNTIRIETDYQRSERVGKALKQYGGDELLNKVKLCLLSKDERAFTAAFNVAYLTLFNRRDISTNTADEKIAEFVYIEDKVNREKIRLSKTLQFFETDSGVLYAPLSPDSDLADVLALQFYKRFEKLPFVIHDIKRGRVSASNGYTLYFTDTPIKLNLLKLKDQKQFDELWKKCYREILLKEKRRRISR